MLKLHDVTLIAFTNKDFEGHKKAIDKSCEGIEFGAVKIIWDETIKNIDDWCRKIVFELGDYVQTSHALLIHENGFVVNPECWKDEWLKYDFAGSPFPLPREGDNVSYRDVNGEIQRVGNSVGLRSKKLLDLPKKLNLEWKPIDGFYNEDGWVSIGNRHIFEAAGCKYMPFEEALYFGRENELPENQDIEKTFIFHNYKGRNGVYADRTF